MGTARSIKLSDSAQAILRNISDNWWLAGFIKNFQFYLTLQLEKIRKSA
jgi:hypothetical protein